MLKWKEKKTVVLCPSLGMLMKMGGEKKSMYFGLTITLETGHLLFGGWEVLVHFHFPAYNRHLHRLYHGIGSITSPPPSPSLRVACYWSLQSCLFSRKENGIHIKTWSLGNGCKIFCSLLFSGPQESLTPSPFVPAHPLPTKICGHFFRESMCIKNYKLQKELLFSDLSVSSVYNNECHLIYYPALPSSHLSSFNFNSKKWLTCNFSLLHLYIIQYTGSENTQRHQVQVVNLI